MRDEERGVPADGMRSEQRTALHQVVHAAAHLAWRVRRREGGRDEEGKREGWVNNCGALMRAH